MEKVKNIDLVFENCEYVTLEVDEFECLAIDRVRENVAINCFQYTDGEIIRDKTCEDFHICINKKGLNKITNMGNDTLKKRLSESNDITYIMLNYEDGKEETIYVEWDESNCYFNNYQKLEWNEDGSIEIDIKEV